MLTPETSPLFYKERITIVPLQSGSGSRIKILEAQYTVCHCTTQKGAEGLHPDLTQAIFIAGAEPEGFARTCMSCLENSRTAIDRAAKLQRLVKIHHERDRVISELSVLVGLLLKRHRRGMRGSERQGSR